MINKENTVRFPLYIPKKLKAKWEKQAKRDAKIMKVPKIPLNIWIISRVELSTDSLA